MTIPTIGKPWEFSKPKIQKKNKDHQAQGCRQNHLSWEFLHGKWRQVMQGGNEVSWTFQMSLENVCIYKNTHIYIHIYTYIYFNSVYIYICTYIYKRIYIYSIAIHKFIDPHSLCSLMLEDHRKIPRSVLKLEMKLQFSMPSSYLVGIPIFTISSKFKHAAGYIFHYPCWIIWNYVLSKF